MTRFERITSSPEMLAEFLRQFSCYVCPYNSPAKDFDCTQSSKSCDELMLEWLKEECDD